MTSRNDVELDCDGFHLVLPNVKDAFIFDEQNGSHPRFHGSEMSSVDIIIELEDRYYFVELKDFLSYQKFHNSSPDVRDLQKSLKYKYRDTFLFRYLEDKVDKPIHY